ncbi:MAG: tetratricopeptide repeat protein [Myxococcota bacterium]
MSGRSELLFNLHLCHQQLGQFQQAITYLRRYLAETPEIRNRSNVESRLKRLEERHGDLLSDEVRPTDSVLETNTTTLSSRTVVSIAMFSAAGASLLSAAILGPWALSEESQLASSDCGALGVCPSGRADRANRLALATDVALGAAAIFAGLGLTFVLLDRDSESSSSEARLSMQPLTVKRGGGAALQGRF